MPLMCRTTVLIHQTQHKHPCPPGGIRTHSPSKRTAADPRLRPRGHGDRLLRIIRNANTLCHEIKACLKVKYTELQIDFVRTVSVLSGTADPLQSLTYPLPHSSNTTTRGGLQEFE